MTVLAFLVALVVLIAVHEYGHYRMAVACDVKVLQFSIGLGRPIWRWRSTRPLAGQDTEFVLGWIPLGGYVRMLDETESEVPAHERERAFNRQSLWRRSAIVAAGPMANFLLAFVLLWGLNVWGVFMPQAILAKPVSASIADQAGLRSGDTVLSVAIEGGAPQDVYSMSDLNWKLMQNVGVALDLLVQSRESGKQRQVQLDLTQAHTDSSDAQWLRSLGFQGAWTAPVVTEVVPASVAQSAGIKRGDRVLRVDGKAPEDASELRHLIRQAGQTDPPKVQIWEVQRRGDSALLIEVKPERAQDGPSWVGRVGVRLGEPPAQTLVRHGPVQAAQLAGQRCWELSVTTVHIFARMLVGQASWGNLSGPVTMAEQAGQSAQQGWTTFLAFLAFVSVGLAVLNLLPIPILDGGHLMCYLWEAVTGSPPAKAWMAGLQKLGLAAVLSLMAVALYNDVARWLF
jgi:regulator of sigma E protease